MKTRDFQILAEACDRAYWWYENRANICQSLYEEHANFGNERGVDERAIKAAKKWGFGVKPELWSRVYEAYDVSVRMRNRLAFYCAKIHGMVSADEETWSEGLRVLGNARKAGGKRLEERFDLLDMSIFN